MDNIPLWSILLVTLSVVLLAIELGFHVGVWRARVTEEGEANISATTGASLALLAFILAFTFGIAADHHFTRKQLLTEEANALETAHLRARLVHTPEGDAIQRLLLDYAKLRATLPGDNPEESAWFVASTTALQADIWNEVEQLSMRDKLTVIDSLLVQSINEVFDVHQKRATAGLRNRIPVMMWIALVILTCMSMIAIGYFSGTKGKRMPVVNSGLALSFSIVIFLIADLDRPGRGLVKTDMGILRELNQHLNEEAKKPACTTGGEDCQP